MYLVSYRKHYRPNLWNEITVDKEGVASVTCMFSRPGMPIRTIGQFRHELASHETMKIHDCIIRNALHKKSIIATPPLAGRRLTNILLLKENQWIENSFPCSGPTPEALVEFENIMIETMKEVGKHPLRAFYIENKFSFSRVFPGENVEIEFQMTNDGRLPIKVFNPSSLAKPGGCTLNFLVWALRHTSSEFEATEYYTTFETAGMEYAISSHRVLPSDQDYLYFKPGENLISKITLRFPKYEAGRYLFQLMYVSLAEFGEDIELVSGAYHGNPVSIEVTSHSINAHM
jgi:hypothetical protein